MLGFIPGLLHAWYIIAKYPDPEIFYEPLSQDSESGRVTYVIVQSPNGGSRRVPKNSVRNGQTGGAAGGYGTTVPMAPPVHQDANGTWSNSAVEGSSGGVAAVPPPTYADAVKGDHKVQTRD
jgi:hypothetical protein